MKVPSKLSIGEFSLGRILLACIFLQVLATTFLLHDSQQLALVDSNLRSIYGALPHNAWSLRSDFPVASRVMNTLTIPVFFLSIVWGGKEGAPKVRVGTKQRVLALLLLGIMSGGATMMIVFYKGEGFTFLALGRSEILFTIFSWLPHLMAGFAVGCVYPLIKFIFSNNAQ